MAYNQSYSAPPAQNRYYQDSAHADYPPPLPQDQYSNGSAYQQGSYQGGYNQDAGGYGEMGNPYGDAGNPYSQSAQPPQSRGPLPQNHDNSRQPYNGQPRNPFPPQPSQRPPPQGYPPSQPRGLNQPPPPGRRGPPPNGYQSMPPPSNMMRPGPGGPPPSRGRMALPNGLPAPRPGPGMQNPRARSQSRGRQGPPGPQGNGRPQDVYNYNEVGPYGNKQMRHPNQNGYPRAPGSRDGGPMPPPQLRNESRPGSSRRPMMDEQFSPQVRNADNPFPAFSSRGPDVRPSMDQPRPNFEQQQRPSMDQRRPDFDMPKPDFIPRERPSMDQQRPNMLPKGVSDSSLTSRPMSQEIYNGVVHMYARDDSRDRRGDQQNGGQFALPDRSAASTHPAHRQTEGDSETLVAANEPWSAGTFPEFYTEDDSSGLFEMPAQDVPVELPGDSGRLGHAAPMMRSRTASPPREGQPMRNPNFHRVGEAGNHGSFHSDPGLRNAMRAQPTQARGPSPQAGFAAAHGRDCDSRMNGQYPRQGNNQPLPSLPQQRPGMQDRGYSAEGKTGAPSDRNGVERPHHYQGLGQARTATSALPLPSPDALPYHATPMEAKGPQGQAQLGLPQTTSPGGQQSSKPAPMRQYNGAVPTANGAKRPVSTPITLASLTALEELARANPNDSQTQLKLARAYFEAATTLSGADPKSRVANQTRYNNAALKLLRTQVAKQDPEAMFYFADCYGDGRGGLEIDPKEAFTLYQNAAKLNHAGAAYRTAVCCEIGAEEGGGTRKDTVKAFQWYKRAATLGDVPAQYKMGIILLKGLLGQEKSPTEAVSYLQRAAQGADAENPHALHELALLYEAPPISPTGASVILKDEPQALRLFEQAAKLGYKYAQFKLGQAYEYGLLGCPIKARDSIIWYTKAAAQGEHQSELALSGWYLTGSEGILECSDTEAYLWARKAALAAPPLPKAMFAMGYFTEVGIGCPRSLDEAKRWYGRAAAYRFPKAQERLDELRRGGEKAMTQAGRPGTSGGASGVGSGSGNGVVAGGQVRDHREKLTRNKKDVKKDDDACIVM